MSNPQRLMKLGKLSDLRRQLKALEHRSGGIVQSIQIATFVETSVFDLDAEKLGNFMDELREVITSGNAMRSQIDSLEEELGV